MPELVAPTTRVHVSFLAAMAEFAAEGRGLKPDRSMLGSDLREQAELWASDGGFAAYVAAVRAEALEETPRPDGWVPSTTLWWAEADDYLGRVAIRHRLTPWLHEVGGHIGYDVRPSARRQGHATAMVRAALPVARGLGIESALVTCDIDNTGSRRVIEANGGVLADQRGVKLRYWVPTA